MAKSNRWCFFIPVEAFEEGRGYIPSIVTENEPGHAPLIGGPLGTPWYWGMDYQTARDTAAAANAEQGLTPADVLAIVASSMAASQEDS